MGEGPFGLPGVGRVQGDLDAAHRGFDPGADLEQLQPQGSAGGGRKLGVRQADPTEGAEQDVGQGREPEAQLIGAHAAGGGAVGKEIELALLDAVFHVAARAIEALIEPASRNLAGLQRGDDEARVGLVAQPLRLGDHAPPARPAVQRRPEEVLVAPDRPAAPPGLLLGPLDLAGDLPGQAGVAGQAKEELDLIGLAPGHQLLAGEAGIAAQQNAGARPARADLVGEARNLLDCTGRRILVGTAELGSQQVAATVDVERQIAVAVVIAVEKAPLLLPVQRDVGRIQVQDDLRRGLAPGFQEELDKEALDRFRVVDDLVVAARRRAAQLQPVQGRLARHRRTVLPPRLHLARQQRHYRIMAQAVVVVQILVAQYDAKEPLPHQCRDPVLDQLGPPMILKTGGNALHQPDRSIRRSQQQSTSVRRDVSTAKGRLHATLFDGCKLKQLWGTLCLHRGPPLSSKRGKTPGQSGCDGRFSDEVRERRDLVRTGDQEAIAEITPEGDAELVACLHQREEGVPTVPAELGACAGTDLAPGNLAADVVFGAIGMERDLGALQDLQKIIFLGVEAREQPIQADEACAGAEDALEAPPQLGPAPWRRITAVSLEVGIEPPDTLADALQGLALPVAEALELVYQTFGMDPALGVLAEPELTGTVTEDDGVGE